MHRNRHLLLLSLALLALLVAASPAARPAAEAVNDGNGGGAWFKRHPDKHEAGKDDIPLSFLLARSPQGADHSDLARRNVEFSSELLKRFGDLRAVAQRMEIGDPDPGNGRKRMEVDPSVPDGGGIPGEKRMEVGDPGVPSGGGGGGDRRMEVDPPPGGDGDVGKKRMEVGDPISADPDAGDRRRALPNVVDDLFRRRMSREDQGKKHNAPRAAAARGVHEGREFKSDDREGGSDKVLPSDPVGPGSRRAPLPGQTLVRKEDDYTSNSDKMIHRVDRRDIGDGVASLEAKDAEALKKFEGLPMEPDRRDFYDGGKAAREIVEARGNRVSWPLGPSKKRSPSGPPSAVDDFEANSEKIARVDRRSKPALEANSEKVARENRRSPVAGEANKEGIARVDRRKLGPDNRRTDAGIDGRDGFEANSEKIARVDRRSKPTLEANSEKVAREDRRSPAPWEANKEGIARVDGRKLGPDNVIKKGGRSDVDIDALVHAPTTGKGVKERQVDTDSMVKAPTSK